MHQFDFRRTVTALLMVLLTVSGGSTGKLYAVDGDIWRRVISGAPVGPSLVHDDGSITVLADDRNLYRFHSDGRPVFRLGLRTRNDRLVAGLPDGSVLLAREDGSLTRVSHAGEIAWSLQPTPSAVERAAVSNTGFLVLTYAGGGLRALTYAGHEIWSRRVGASIRYGPFIDGSGRLILVTADSELLVLGPGGDVRISYDLETMPTSVVLRSDGTLLTAREDGSLTIIQPDSGRERVIKESIGHGAFLQTDTSGRPVVLHDGVLQVLDGEGNPEIIADGVQSAVVAGADRFVVIRADSTIEVLNTNGSVQASVRVADAGELSEPVAGRNGQVIVTGSRWVVYGFRVSGGQGPMWSGPEGSGSRDYRPGVVRGESRSTWRTSTEFRFFEEMVTSGMERQQRSVLEELETRAEAGTLGAAYSYASYILGVLVGVPGASGSRQQVSIELLRRGYDLLAWLGDNRAHSVMEHGAQLYRDETRVGILMDAIADIGYSHRIERQDMLLSLLRRNERSPRVQTAFIAALQTMHEQGYPPSESALETLTSLTSIGATASVRDAAREFISRVSRSN
ncbi:MAG: PQQ-binding-like beta-propeller repeat protein [Spirochaetaceae bacterium]